MLDEPEGKTLALLLEDTNRVRRAAEAFREEKHHLFYSASLLPIPRYVGERVYTTGDDVLSAAEALIQEFVVAEKIFAEFVASDRTMLSFPESRRLATAFKGVHMWLRAYQDAICGLFTALQRGTVGSYPSMNGALKPGKPLRSLLSECLPRYEPWFHEWRKRRDQMKLGATFRTAIDFNPARIQGIRFVLPSRMGSPEIETHGFVGLEDVILGLEMSTQLTNVIRQRVEAADPSVARELIV